MANDQICISRKALLVSSVLLVVFLSGFFMNSVITRVGTKKTIYKSKASELDRPVAPPEAEIFIKSKILSSDNFYIFVPDGTADMMDNYLDAHTIFAVAEVDTNAKDGTPLTDPYNNNEYKFTPKNRSCLFSSGTTANQNVFKGTENVPSYLDKAFYSLEDLSSALVQCKDVSLIFYQSLRGGLFELSGIYYYNSQTNGYIGEFAVSPEYAINSDYNTRTIIPFNELTVVEMNKFTGKNMPIQKNTQSGKAPKSNQAPVYDGATTGGSNKKKEIEIQQQSSPLPSTEDTVQ